MEKKIISDVEKLKKSHHIEKAYIFGSYLNEQITCKDIDVILYSNKYDNDININSDMLSLPLKRVQYNYYSKKKGKQDHLSLKAYDIVIINDKQILNHFIQYNQGQILEV